VATSSAGPRTSGSFAVRDAYAAAGGNFIDTADRYSQWVAGHRGGESEEIIGRWMTARGNRDDVVLATKVGWKSGREGLGADNVRAATEESLRRLGTDRIDLLYTHRDDEVTPPEETLGALDALVREGKVRYVAASNVTPARLEEAMAASAREGLARYVALQPHYNLVEREYERELAGACARHGLGCLPYFALAKGFLTGKYRAGGEAVDSARAAGAGAYLDARAASRPRAWHVVRDTCAGSRCSSPSSPPWSSWCRRRPPPPVPRGSPTRSPSAPGKRARPRARSLRTGVPRWPGRHRPGAARG
jgi:aryl-alcohol dehydrogenase-like predicted oxidoreductase